MRVGKPKSNHKTYDSSYRMSLRRNCLLQGIIDDEIQEKIVASQRSADFTTTLEMDEQPFVHELLIQEGSESNQPKKSK